MGTVLLVLWLTLSMMGCSLPFTAANTVARTITGTTMGVAKSGASLLRSGAGVMGRGAGAAVQAVKAYPYPLFALSPELSEPAPTP